jgi:hypothetical protein
MMDAGLEVDADAMDVYPNDVPDPRALFPCKVDADGNCLPSCGSVYAYGTGIKAAEMRVRILIELVLYDGVYLDNDCFLKGMTGESSKQLPKIYAQYSDMYVPGMNLNDNMVRNIYQMELMKIRIMWQMHALSSVLKSQIFSIYPKFGNPNVRSDLNRIVMPRNQLSTQKTSIHSMDKYETQFVPVLPIAAANESIENGKMETQ